MKKYKENDFFKITQAPGPDGAWIRLYTVHCRKCNSTASYHASGTSNEGLRKIFMRKGWEIAKKPNQHLCPRCIKAEPAEPAPRYLSPIPSPPKPPTPPPPPPVLPDLWKPAPQPVYKWHRSMDERFLDRLCEKLLNQYSWGSAIIQTVRIAGREVIEAEPSLNPAPRLSSPPPPPPRPPSPSSPPDISNDEDGTADWWKELHAD